MCGGFTFSHVVCSGGVCALTCVATILASKRDIFAYIIPLSLSLSVCARVRACVCVCVVSLPELKAHQMSKV